AVAHLRKALDLGRLAHGPSHPDTLRSMVLLGMVLAELGRPESVDLLKNALQMRQTLYGEEHPLVADSKAQLAFPLWAGARPANWDESERVYREAINTYRRTLGREHPEIARCLTGFASMLHARGLAGESLQTYNKACDMSQRLLGNDHQFTIEC